MLTKKIFKRRLILQERGMMTINKIGGYVKRMWSVEKIKFGIIK